MGKGCMTCEAPDLNFKDKLSIEEYRISGMCQKCQDSTFSSGDSWDDWDNEDDWDWEWEDER